ncbi:MAG: glycosyltransferase family 2 protein [Alphaproteobacteria bacterium]
MQGPAVTVVIPVFNGAATLGAALDSVLAQSFADFEAIVVDDASTDDLAAVLAARPDPRLRLLRLEANRGAGGARNAGIAEARGRLVAFLDADDFWHPDKLARQVPFLDGLPADAAVACTAFVLRRAATGVERIHRPAYRADQPALPMLAFGCDLSPGTTLLARREAFPAVGPFDERLRRLEDWDWLLRYAARGAIGTLDAPLATVNVTGPPDGDLTLAALDLLERKWTHHSHNLLGPHVRRVQSSIWVERAAVHFRRGELIAPIRCVARSFRYYPRRNWRFFLRMAGHLLRPGRR